MGKIKPTQAPLPYTGVYDEEGDRWVSINGEWVLNGILIFLKIAMALGEQEETK